MTQEELKNCPFCGGKAVARKYTVPDGNMHYEAGKIICIVCHVSTAGSILDGYYGAKGSIEDEIKKWNRRTSE